MVIAWLILLGLAFGSFVNAVVWRLKEDKSINGRSMCVYCHHTLAWYDLIPVLSWLRLKGRCRYCKKSISWQYPVVELATAALFIVSYAAWPRELVGELEWAYFGLWLAALVIMVALAVYDFRWMVLPDKLNWPFVLTGIVSVILLAALDSSAAASRLIGAAAAWAFFAAIYYGSRGKWLGGGDVKFAIGLGAWVGWPEVIVGVMAGFYSASLVVLPLLLAKVVTRKQPVPFGPFLILGTIVAMFWGQDVIDWYLNTFLYTGL